MEIMTLELPEDLSISQVETYKTEITSFLNDVSSIRIIDKNIVKIDTVGVQLLLAIVHLLLNKNCQIEWKISSSILKDSIKQLGMDSSELGKYL